METFLKQIENTCKNYYYHEVIKTMQVNYLGETKVAIVSIEEDEKDERHYTIFYKYDYMKNVDCYGYYKSLYNEKGECIHNAYHEACEEFSKYAY